MNGRKGRKIMRKVYVKPEMEMSFFENLDVITTSTLTTANDEDSSVLEEEDVFMTAAPAAAAAISNDAGQEVSVEGDGSEGDGLDEGLGETGNPVNEEDNFENQN